MEQCAYAFVSTLFLPQLFQSWFVAVYNDIYYTEKISTRAWNWVLMRSYYTIPEQTPTFEREIQTMKFWNAHTFKR